MSGCTVCANILYTFSSTDEHPLSSLSNERETRCVLSHDIYNRLVTDLGFLQCDLVFYSSFTTLLLMVRPGLNKKIPSFTKHLKFVFAPYWFSVRI